MLLHEVLVIDWYAMFIPSNASYGREQSPKTAADIKNNKNNKDNKDNKENTNNKNNKHRNIDTLVSCQSRLVHDTNCAANSCTSGANPLSVQKCPVAITPDGMRINKMIMILIIIASLPIGW